MGVAYSDIQTYTWIISSFVIFDLVFFIHHKMILKKRKRFEVIETENEITALYNQIKIPMTQGSQVEYYYDNGVMKLKQKGSGVIKLNMNYDSCEKIKAILDEYDIKIDVPERRYKKNGPLYLD